ncbi:MAG TPA: hypothetical protein VFA83_13580 [Acidimicrobiales bacterium]|nr:hypothetical protein [Acidimicrobiales bacterium]
MAHMHVGRAKPEAVWPAVATLEEAGHQLVSRAAVPAAPECRSMA